MIEASFYGVRDYEDVKPEPAPHVMEVVDREGFPWFRYLDFGWVPAGDATPVPWESMCQWIEAGSYQMKEI